MGRASRPPRGDVPDSCTDATDSGAETTDGTDSETETADGTDGETETTDGTDSEAETTDGADSETETTDGTDSETETADGTDSEAETTDGGEAETDPFAVPLFSHDLLNVDRGHDIIIAQIITDPVIEKLQSELDAGALSQIEYDHILAKAQFLEGAMAIDTGKYNDIVLGSELDDRIHTGSGADLAFGGPGDDYIDLGNNDAQNEYDISGRFEIDEGLYGLAYRHITDDIERDLTGGNDTIIGNRGQYWIKDGYGHNFLHSRMGGDFLNAVDLDALSPDTISAGWGHDHIEADEGDLISVSKGSDTITIHLHAQSTKEGYQPVHIVDFDAKTDTLALTGSYIEALIGESGTDDNISLTITDIDSGEGAVLSLNGIDIVILDGVQGMDPSEVQIV